MATTRPKNASANASFDDNATGKTAEDVANDIKSAASETIDQAKEKVNQFAGEAQKTAKSQLAERKDQVADGMDSVAKALRQTGEQLQNEDTTPVGSYVTKAAATLSSISDHVRQNDVDQLLHEVQDFARREPAIALGSAFAIGVIAARFLKSSQQNFNANESGSRATGNYKGTSQYSSGANANYRSGNTGSWNGPYTPSTSAEKRGSMGSGTGATGIGTETSGGSGSGSMRGTSGITGSSMTGNTGRSAYASGDATNGGSGGLSGVSDGPNGSEDA